jgi:hypothetical protein
MDDSGGARRPLLNIGSSSEKKRRLQRKWSSIRDRTPENVEKLNDHVVLSPWEKWKRYRKLPYTLILHVLLVFIVTSKVLITNSSVSRYYRASTAKFKHFLLPDACDPLQELLMNEFDCYFFEVDDVIHYVNQSVLGYYDMIREDFSTKPFEHLLLFTYYPDLKLNNSASWSTKNLQTDTYHVNETWLGPLTELSKDKRPDLFFGLTQIDHESKVKDVFTYELFGNTYRICVIWQVRVHFVLSYGRVTTTLTSNIRQDCVFDANGDGKGDGSIKDSADHVDILLELFTLSVCTFLVITLFRNLWKSFAALLTIRDLTLASPRSLQRLAGEGVGSGMNWSSLTWWDKLAFFDGWVILTLLAVSLTVGQCILALRNTAIGNRTGSYDDTAATYLSGSSVFLIWISLLRYLQHNAIYSQLGITLSIALPRVAQFGVGVVPVLVAYSLVAVVFFANHSLWFADVDTSFISLFAIMNGDQMADTFKSIRFANPVVAELFLYSFICLFIFVVLNIFIAIVGAAHEATEMIEMLAHDEQHQLELQERQINGAQVQSAIGGAESEERFPGAFRATQVLEAREALHGGHSGLYAQHQHHNTQQWSQFQRFQRWNHRQSMDEQQGMQEQEEQQLPQHLKQPHKQKQVQPFTWRRGDYVLAKRAEDKQWYEAVVVVAYTDGTCSVLFDEEEVEQAQQTAAVIAADSIMLRNEGRRGAAGAAGAAGGGHGEAYTETEVVRKPVVSALGAPKAVPTPSLRGSSGSLQLPPSPRVSSASDRGEANNWAHRAAQERHSSRLKQLLASSRIRSATEEAHRQQELAGQQQSGQQLGASGADAVAGKAGEGRGGEGTGGGEERGS